MRHIISFSTGIPSAIVAYLVCKQHPNAIVLFADVLWEDEDNYRFLDDVESLIGKKVMRLSGGLNPIEIASNEGYAYIPNQMTATCTRKGKIEVIKNFMQDGDILYLGMTHKDLANGRDLDAPIRNWRQIGVTVKYPLIEQNIEPHGYAESLGLLPPEMYSKGYKHANCGGRCVKQGQGDWVRTLIHYPARYMEVEQWEHNQRVKQAIRIYFELYQCLLHPMFLAITKLSKLYTIVRKVVNGANIGVSLRDLRLQHEAEIRQPNFFDMVDELNGYGCTIECGIGNESELQIAFASQEMTR